MHNKKQKLFLLAIAAIFSLFSHRAFAICYPQNVAICDTSVFVPSPTDEDSITKLTVPKPYLQQNFYVQCEDGSYNITDSTAVTCEYMMCENASVNICGRDVAVGGIAVGYTTSVRISLPNNVPPNPNLSFTVRCDDNGANPPYFEVLDPLNVDCSNFACAPVSYNVCDGAAVNIPGGAAEGDVLDMTVPPPYMPDHFRVQCLASGGGAPAYEITDFTGVTCIAQDPSE